MLRTVLGQPTIAMIREDFVKYDDTVIADRVKDCMRSPYNEICLVIVEVVQGCHMIFMN